jgi:hypothetical protein
LSTKNTLWEHPNLRKIIYFRFEGVPKAPHVVVDFETGETHKSPVRPDIDAVDPADALTYLDCICDAAALDLTRRPVAKVGLRVAEPLVAIFAILVVA